MIEIPDSLLPKDKEGNIICQCCQQPEEQCLCPSMEDSKQGEKEVFLTTQRCKKGKMVTVISHLYPEVAFLKKLTKDLKTRLGTGGSYNIEQQEGKITLQGNQINIVMDFLKKNGIKTKI